MKNSITPYLGSYFSYIDKKSIAGEIQSSMILRYAIACTAIAFLFFSHDKIPFAHPQLLIVAVFFLVSSVMLHLLSIKQDLRPVVFLIMSYLDISIAPFVIHFSGGFLSPFMLSHLCTAICSGIVYINNRHYTKYASVYLLISYVAVAFFQKSGLLYNTVGYSREMMQHTLFFYFVVLTNALLIGIGILLVEMVHSNVHKSLDELTRSFDAILKGTTAVVNEEFFSNLTRYSVETWQVKCVLIGEVVQKNRYLSTLAICNNGEMLDNFTCPLSSSIANEVLTHPKQQLINPETSTRYPDDPLTRLFPVKFIFGLPLYNSNEQIIGVLLALNDATLQTEHLAVPLISIFASRASAELERKIANENRAAVEQKLSHAKKMEALGQLASGIAHDFNNVIGAISGYAGLLMKRLGPDYSHLNYIENIHKATKNASDMINQLSQFVKNDKRVITPVDLHSVIHTTISMMRTSSPESIRFETCFSVETKLVTAGDEALLQNVLLNLALNARDACKKEGGTVTFFTSVVQLEGSDILCQSFSIKPGMYISVTVSDTGSGIDEETLSHIFEPFFTTKPKGKGTGLGLANVWSYIETFKGAIEVKSESDHGTSFTLYLPTSGEYTYTLPGATCSTGEGAIKTILLVDDEPSVREIYAEILLDRGYEVFKRSNGQEALDFIEKEERSVDLIILDMIMPVLNGPDTFRAIRDILPSVRILLISGFTTAEKLRPLLNQPPSSFLQKPCDAIKLLESVKLMANMAA